MFVFFYSLIRAVLTGTWFTYQETYVMPKFNYFGNKLASFLIATLGGNFTELQNFTFFGSTAEIGIEGGFYYFDLIGIIGSIILCLGIIFTTWKVIKRVLAIFFEGWR